MKKVLLAILCLFLSVPAGAVPPVTQISPSEAKIVVEYPKLDSYQQGRNLTLKFHTYNTTGYLVTNDSVSCEISLCAEDCFLVTKKTLAYDDTYDYWHAYYDETNELGEYAYLVYCNGSAGAGYVSTGFLVTTTGVTQTYEWQLPISLLVVGLMAFIIVISVILDKTNVFMRIAKTFFILVAFYLSTAVIQLALGFARTNSAGAHIVGTLELIYVVDVWIVRIFTGLVFLYIMYEALKALAGRKEDSFEDI